MRKILYISGTRADYGLMKNTLLLLKKYPGLSLKIAATGMHLMPEFGNTVEEILRDKSRVAIIPADYKSDNKESTLEFLGEFILKLTAHVKRARPDIILVLGDRAEMLGGAIVGAYLAIPVAHIHGGEVSSTADEFSRHAITKLSHLHFAASQKSAERIIRMGEDPWRVHMVGAPGLDSILKDELYSAKEIARKYKVDLRKPFLLVVQHPVTLEFRDSEKNMRATMEAVRELGYQSAVIYPNADAGGRKMIRVIKLYKRCPFIRIYKSVPRKDYLSLMRIASAVIGNSSSGIIESTLFKVPCVNIGTRQLGRERSNNVIDAGYDKRQIAKAVHKALYDRKFRNKLEKCRSPYGDGKAGERIARVLSRVKIDLDLLQKRIGY